MIVYVGKSLSWNGKQLLYIKGLLFDTHNAIGHDSAESYNSQLLSMVWVNKRWTFMAKRKKTSSREEMEEHKVNYFQGLV